HHLSLCSRTYIISTQCARETLRNGHTDSAELELSRQTAGRARPELRVHARASSYLCREFEPTRARLQRRRSSADPSKTEKRTRVRALVGREGLRARGWAW